ncbi:MULTISPECIES: FadR/GntR family transcriptional regulator [Streptomyces]|uniref:DNA-binding FadR family transcriptional regulator n=1 Tax=Streptomyces demainii TaxID=588122 RepID=A0ABT9KVM7_9ACTN|nr:MULTISPECIES: FCD domain-containing protein [Streptomyces]MCO8305409.1 FCD domain-containing protein [Streptomyces sp. RKCA744]MDP9612488.1 DNA-binding FadR family transcriptional regulator [Streptomyces demainii]
MPGTRSSRTLLRQEVVEGIKRYILRERLRPGDPLPTEPALCEALGASRSSVREAIKILDALDIVDVRHGHGTYVGRLSLSALVESLTFRGLLSPGDDFQVLADLVDVRELFERGMAERIVSSLSSEQLDTLDSLVQTMRETGAGDGGGFVAADRAFHALLIAPVGNDLIGQLSMAFWDVYTIVAPHLDGFTHADELSTISAHQSLVDAARAEDTTAFLKALEEHYAPVRRRVTEARARDDAAS